MKKRKHHTKRKVSGVRRRKSHAMHGIDTTNILGVVAGAVIAGYLNKLVPATVNDKIVAGGKVALGIALPMFVKSGNMKNIVGGIGSGMIAVGAVDLLKSFGALNGDFDIPVISGDVLSGDVLSGDIDVINGDDDFMNGDDDFMNGDDDFMSGDDDFMNGDED
jgi:hypothetical protein